MSRTGKSRILRRIYRNIMRRTYRNTGRATSLREFARQAARGEVGDKMLRTQATQWMRAKRMAVST